MLFMVIKLFTHILVYSIWWEIFTGANFAEFIATQAFRGNFMVLNLALGRPHPPSTNSMCTRCYIEIFMVLTFVAANLSTKTVKFCTM